MKDEERGRFESLENLRRAAYESFNDRRSHEWKFSLSLWGAEAILLAGLLQPFENGEVFPLKGCCVRCVAVVFGSLLVLLYGYWQHCAARANSVDKDVSRHFADEMVKILSLPYSKELQDKIDRIPKDGTWRSWSNLAQIGITILWTLAVVMIIYIRSS